MKVSLSVLNRLMVINSMPSEEAITTLRLVRKVKEQVGFTDEELKALEFVNTDGKLVWKDVVPPKEFDLSEKTVEIITATLKALSDKKKVTDAHLDLYDKIVQDVV